MLSCFQMEEETKLKMTCDPFQGRHFPYAACAATLILNLCVCGGGNLFFNYKGNRFYTYVFKIRYKIIFCFQELMILYRFLKK